ncbi:beta-ketoacyl synthase chain length factor [Vibrio sp. ZSDE26]|uniref:Beta-ketoacyl synthase chain length factor n=1 Tax=Vibrio amylolyticus TaxID=2847292 RepID=A0A9X1XKF3_9VIBR|nr:beta-ketoacyl synthase chain length factor [Vibrio amylolyticus]MCK6264361.1 beta-ketoacyl synthase chain length factor [Vibrio amylolyticus]
MSNQTQIASFEIVDYLAQSAGIHLPEQWQQWANDNQWPQEGKVEVSHIPPMMRRRMSSLSKLALQTALQLLNKHNVDYLVFASRHGELQRSAALIKDIVQGEEASPMAFSQSVHNTAAGLATIAAKKPLPATSIAAGVNTFQSAIVDAWLYLTQHPTHKVLLIDFDEPVPEIYEQYENQQYNGYSLGLILSKGHEFSIKTSPSHNLNRSTVLKSRLPQGLDFLQHYLLNHKEWQLNGDLQGWKWTRCI